MAIPTTLEIVASADVVVSPVEVVTPTILNLNGEEVVVAIPTTLTDFLDSALPTYSSTTLEFAAPMTLNWKSETTAIPTTLKENLASAVPTHASTTLQMVILMALDLKGEEVPGLATKPTTNLNAGYHRPKTSTRPTKTNAAGMTSRLGLWAWAETSAYSMLPPTRPTFSVWLAHPLLRPSHCHVLHVSPALLWE